MAHVELTVPAPPEKVHQVLADGWTYSSWMVGPGHVIQVDPDWPAPGSRIHHKTGLGKASQHGETVVVEHRPDSRLVLRSQVPPLGRSRLTIQLAPAPDGARVTLDESIDFGPLRGLRNAANDLLLRRRHRESLRRLADIAVHRRAVRSALGGDDAVP